jgi:VanZ family protein
MSKQISRQLRFNRLLACLWMLTIFWLSSQPKLAELPLFWGADKILHTVVFGILGILYLRSWPALGGRFSPVRLVIIPLLVGFYGITDEVHQIYVPGRTASVTDLLADIFGGFLAALVFFDRQST